MATIKGGAWDTVIGKMEYDAKGDIKQIDYVVYKWDNEGGYAEIPRNCCPQTPRFGGAFFGRKFNKQRMSDSCGLEDTFFQQILGDRACAGFA
jgi:hypothetical protein